MSSVIYANELSVGYNSKVVVPNINFELEEGQTLALVGANGCGKTTLLKTICALLPKISGELSIFGAEAGKTPSQVAYMGQFNPTGFLLPLKVFDVVMMGRFGKLGLLGRITRHDKEIVSDCMRRMGIEQIANKPLNSLSGGQRQRVFLANTLAHEAKLVLLDEPTASLDVAGIELYENMVASLKKEGAAVVIATHNINEAAKCDKAMLLAERVVAYGNGSEVLTAQSLLATFGIIAKLEDGKVVVVEKEHGHGCCGQD